MNTIGLFGVLAGSAVAFSLFLASFFLVVKRKENEHFLWLGLILMAIGLRVGKSIFYFLLNDMAPIGLAFGFLGLASIGPLVWLMVRQEESVQPRMMGHFVFPILGAIACFLVSPSPWETYLYKFATLVLLGYLLISWRNLLRSVDSTFRTWNLKILIMVSGVWVALVYQHVSATMMDYAWGAMIASIFLYWIFFESFKTGIFPKGISVSLPDQTVDVVRKAFENDRLFKAHGMNLQQFASQLDIPPYLVTRSVKQLYDRSFPETLNHFRVEEVKQLLLDSKKEHLKIESLAYEVGFASPSAFYAAFKKHTGQTPTAYQKAALLSA